MTTNAFAYNGFGARVRKSDSSGTTTYLRSGTSVVAPVVAGFPDHDRIDTDMPPLVVLGHELGHVYGYRENPDETGQPGDNVRRVENPLRKVLGLPERIRY
jgi:hypothetical protein